MGYLLTPEETEKAFDNAFETPVDLDHKPTIEEIFALTLKAVTKAQLEKVKAEIEKMEYPPEVYNSWARGGYDRAIQDILAKLSE